MASILPGILHDAGEFLLKSDLGVVQLINQDQSGFSLSVMIWVSTALVDSPGTLVRLESADTKLKVDWQAWSSLRM